MPQRARSPGTTRPPQTEAVRLSVSLLPTTTYLLLHHPRLDLDTWSLAKIRVPERFGGWSNVGLGLGEVVAATDETFGGGGGGN